MKTAIHRHLMASNIGNTAMPLSACHGREGARGLLDRAHRSAKMALRRDARQHASQALEDMAEEARLAAARRHLDFVMREWRQQAPVPLIRRDWAAYTISKAARAAGLSEGARRALIAEVAPKCDRCGYRDCPGPETCMEHDGRLSLSWTEVEV